ncbi:LOW QUALITY PROTEIN: hypothetical protein V2J09_005298, partial [Rumex salicifolius]
QTIGPNKATNPKFKNPIFIFFYSTILPLSPKHLSSSSPEFRLGLVSLLRQCVTSSLNREEKRRENSDLWKFGWFIFSGFGSSESDLWVLVLGSSRIPIIQVVAFPLLFNCQDPKISVTVRISSDIMGCICSKGASVDEYVENNHVRERETRPAKRLITSSRTDEVVIENDGVSNDVTTRLISGATKEDNVGSISVISEKPTRSQTQKHSTVENGGERMKMSRVASMPNGAEVASIAAGWPAWLTAVAGEAISGWVPRRADSFEKLDKALIVVARDLETRKIVAMKKVRFVTMDPESVRFMAREIRILRMLDHPNVMKLECLVTSRVSGSLYLVFEYMEHDLAGLAARPGVKFTESQIKCYMQQLFRGLEHCHKRGVLHRDIKGSNLLIDKNGNLKIGDFGLATFFRHNQRQPLTSRVVTLWYRPPELLLGSTDYGIAVDLWSAGCILAELFYGKPIMPGRTEVEQIHRIFKLCGSPSEEYWKKSRLSHATIFKPQHTYSRCVAETFKNFPSSALDLLSVLLDVEPEERGSASSALDSEFFTTKPLPCNPSILPKYPPSKEFDARRRDEEARRQRASSKGIGQDSAKKEVRKSKAVPAPDANAELQVSIQKRYGLANPRSSSEKFSKEEDGGSGFPIEPSRGLIQNSVSHSRNLSASISFSHSKKNRGNEDEVHMDPNKTSTCSTNMSEFRAHGSSASRGSLRLSRFASSVNASRGAEVDNNFDEQRYANGNNLDSDGPSAKHGRSNRSSDKTHSSNKKDYMTHEKEYSPVERIHCSGPLFPTSGNMDEMLREHEKQVTQAVRKSRFDKPKPKPKKAYGDSGQMESLLHHGTKARTNSFAGVELPLAGAIFSFAPLLGTFAAVLSV